MPETLTESFCERCGTRYTFESARPKIRLKGVKVLSRGLKNFVLSDDTTMDEAMAAARSETDRESTAHQLDAFHKTFNFCMSCRQYTCPNCWNEVEARCQSCAPLPEPEFAVAPQVVPPEFPGLVPVVGTASLAEAPSNGVNGHDHELDRERDVVVAHESEPAPEPDQLEPESSGEAARSPQGDAGHAAKATRQTAGLFSRFRPGQNLDDELAAFERERSSDEPATGAASVEAVEAEAIGELDAAAMAEAAPEAAAEAVLEAAPSAPAEPAAEVVAIDVPTLVSAEPAEAHVEALADLEPEPVSAAPAVTEPPAADVVEQPTWRITAPDLDAPAVGAPPVGTPPRADEGYPLQATVPSHLPAEPQWPARPEWPAPKASAGLPFLGRPAQPQGGVDSLWAASNRELVATPPAPGRSTSGIQPCVSCGLSLSANARFCRRCGTLQGG